MIGFARTYPRAAEQVGHGPTVGSAEAVAEGHAEPFQTLSLGTDHGQLEVERPQGEIPRAQREGALGGSHVGKPIR